MTNQVKKKYLKDIFFMKKTIFLSKKGQYTTHPNPSVGCIIVYKNKIVGIGWHKFSGDHHAEVYAIKMAKFFTKNSTAYISLEPCNFFGKTPPCCHLIINTGIKRVVIATLDPNPKVSGTGIKFLKKNGIKITTGILEKESQKINYGFFKRMNTGIPWIKMKMAISIDGKISMQTGESKWITSKKARQDVHYLRALSSAILSTSETILKDNPILSVRYCHNKHIKIINKKYFQPIRIILDSQNRIYPDHNIIQNGRSNIWLIRLYKDDQKWPNHVKQIIISSYKNKINLKELLKFLGKKKINVLWIECGAHLYSQLLNMKIIDELILYIAPKMLGHVAQSLYLNTKYITLNQSPKFIFKNIKNIGNDIRIILKPTF